METMTLPLMHRRGFFAAGTAAYAGATLCQAAPMPNRPRIAVALSTFTPRSHAHVILENFLEPYLFRGQRVEPPVTVASIYCEQYPKNDMLRGVAETYGIKIASNIADAMRCGGDRIAVDAVLLIVEQGEYPVNARGQREYPRKRFFDEALAVLDAEKKVLPVFLDKHFSYRLEWSLQIAAAVRQRKLPFMAGSSVPLAQRSPAWELPAGVKIEEAVSIHGGPFEAYDIHALEVHQSVVEGRPGGETGIASVQYVDGQAFWRAGETGAFSWELVKAALETETGPIHGDIKELLQTKAWQGQPPHAILIRYKDGLNGAVLRLGASGIRWNFACRLVGDPKPKATRFHVGPWNNRNLFKAFSHAIQHLCVTGQPAYPWERTELTTLTLHEAVESRAAGGTLRSGEHLAVHYQPVDWQRFREDGSTWKIITDQTPEPPGIPRGGVFPK
jgi:hypothetical protein